MSPSKPARTAQAVDVIEFTDVLQGERLVAVSANHGLDPIVLSLRQPPDYRIRKSGASFPKRHASVPNSFSIHHCVTGDWHSIELEPTHENFHSIQPLGKDKWLLIRGRAGSREDNNASVYDVQGRRLWTFHAGDGVEDVQTTEAGTIWVGYFDEGVYGGNDFGPAGLLCFDERGKVLFRYDSLYAQHNVPVIDDCYALNVCSVEETWLYYYNSFPLVKLVDGQVEQAWHEIPVKGSHAFAVEGQRALFCGSYKKRNSLFLVHLESMSMQELRPLNAKGQPIKPFRGFGRRSRMHLRTNESLYHIDLSDL